MDAPRLAGFERRPDRLGSMFSAISWRYDFLNALMSLGPGRGVAAGAGGVDPRGRARARPVLRLGALVGPGVRARADDRDRRRRLLRHARARADLRGAARAHASHPVHGDGFHLPFRDATFDVVTAAFGLRNLVPLPEAAREIRRVLKPGGRFLALDSVAPAGTAFAPFHAAYLRHVVPLLGRLSPDPNAYRYLSESIFDFGPPDEVARRLEDAGFETPVRVRPLLLGAVALFEGTSRNALPLHARAEEGIVQSGETGRAREHIATAGGGS